jgi:hypothetical protein
LGTRMKTNNQTMLDILFVISNLDLEI